jgi:uncharacterized membrane protein YdfJ with MMPL/SSD domain
MEPLSADTVEKHLLIVGSQTSTSNKVARKRNAMDRLVRAIDFMIDILGALGGVAGLKRAFGETLNAFWSPSQQWSYLPCFASLLPSRSWRDSIVALICGGLSDDGMSGSSGAALLRLLPR